MQLLFMKQWLSDSVVRAICWTLIHSLWQGLILAALAGLLVLFTRRSVAAFRYNMLATLFFVFMGVVAFTFVRELNRPASGNTVVSLTPVNPTQVTSQLSLPEDPAIEVYQEEGYIARFTGYFNQHASLLVAVWFLVFLAKTVKLMSGLVYIQRIRHYKVHTPAGFWIGRMKELAHALGIKMPVRLLESELVKVPLVAGFLKPVILVPIGLMANLPAEQVEAILLHELAHIRRRDFLVNLAQSFAEILFFFNPAVLWLSSLLREEREHCCDDMAIAVTQSKTGYIHALVSFQEYQIENTPPYALAFPGKKNQLLNRVKRIIDNNNKTLNMAEKSFLVLCFSLIGILAMVFAQPDKKNDSVKKAAQQKKELLSPGKDIQVKDRKTGKDLSKDESKDESTDQSGSGTSDESRDMSAQQETTASYTDTSHQAVSYQPYSAQYQPYTPTYEAKLPVRPTIKDTLPVLRKGNSVMTGTITHNKEGKKYKITIDNNLATGLMIDGVKVPDEKLIEYRDLIGSIFRQMQADADESYGTQVKEAEENTSKLLKESSSLQINQLKLQKEVLSTDQKRSTLDIEPIKLDRQAKLQLKGNVELKKQDRTVIDDIIDDMVSAGIITQTNPLTFKINKNEFVVNEKQQPEALKRRFLDKYVKSPGNIYLYSRNGGTTNSTVITD